LTKRDPLEKEVRNIVQEVATKTIPKKKKCKKAKWLSEEALQILEEREAKGKGERERCTQLNAEFQRIARRDKNALNEQCKEIEENNTIGRTRDLFKKIGDMKGTFYAKMGMIKDQNGRDLREAEEIKKRWQDYTEELYKKELNIPDNHDGVVTDLEPDILECEVKWALGSLSNNKASGGDSIPAELFKILKDDAVKVLHSICQQIWKTQQWPQDWKRSVSIPIPKKGNAKECSNYCTIALISHASKVMLKILQARLQQYVDRELPEVQAGFRRGRGTRDQIANIHWIMEKAREFQKNIYFCFIDYAKAFDCVDHNKLWQVLKEMGVPGHLICLLRNLYAGQEATVRTGHGTTDWFKIEKGVRQGCILSPCLFNLYAEHIMRKAGLDESPVGIKIAGRNINNLRYADDTTLMAESEEELKSLLMRVKEESAKVGLKLNIKKTKIMASSPLTSWQIDGEEMEVVTDFIFLGSKITADGDCNQEIKRHLLLGRNSIANLDSILKSRDITLPTKVRIVKAMVFPVAMYGCESWTIRKAECQGIEAFELWC
ncbi:LINE-1 retrotransposable element ORF2 protein, partial [Varanus komodoensis]